MSEICATTPRDLASNKLASLLFWGLPIAAIIATSFVDRPVLRTIVWTAAWTEMGAVCLVNAFRCGRLHCYLTGPFFILGGVASLLYGLGILPLGWGQIGMTMLVGGVALTYLPEWVWGKYTGRAA